MNIFLNSLAPVYLILTLIPSKVTSDEYIKQEPNHITLEVGQSANFMCKIEKNVEIQEVQFWKNNGNLLKLTINTSDIISKMSFSGTFGEFKWILDDGEKNTASYTCTDKTETNALKSSEEVHQTNQIECPSPEESSTHVSLNEGSQEVASLSVIPGEYRSRLAITGTIMDFNLTLKNVQISDMDSYQCKGRASGITEDLQGHLTLLTVREPISPTTPPKNHGKSSHTVNLGPAFAMALALCLLKL